MANVEQNGSQQIVREVETSFIIKGEVNPNEVFKAVSLPGEEATRTLARSRRATTGFRKPFTGLPSKGRMITTITPEEGPLTVRHKKDRKSNPPPFDRIRDKKEVVSTVNLKNQTDVEKVVYEHRKKLEKPGESPMHLPEYAKTSERTLHLMPDGAVVELSLDTSIVTPDQKDPRYVPLAGQKREAVEVELKRFAHPDEEGHDDKNYLSLLAAEEIIIERLSRKGIEVARDANGLPTQPLTHRKWLKGLNAQLENTNTKKEKELEAA